MPKLDASVLRMKSVFRSGKHKIGFLHRELINDLNAVLAAGDQLTFDGAPFLVKSVKTVATVLKWGINLR